MQPKNRPGDRAGNLLTCLLQFSSFLPLPKRSNSSKKELLCPFFFELCVGGGFPCGSAGKLLFQAWFFFVPNMCTLPCRWQWRSSVCPRSGPRSSWWDWYVWSSEQTITCLSPLMLLSISRDVWWCLELMFDCFAFLCRFVFWFVAVPLLNCRLRSLDCARSCSKVSKCWARCGFTSCPYEIKLDSSAMDVLSPVGFLVSTCWEPFSFLSNDRW